MSTRKEILIIGGGVIGICAAYYLTKCGRQVTLLESDDICSGASYGNAGFILYSHIIPLAAPGALGQGLKWLLDTSSPFYIKPRLSLELASWLWLFYRASSKKNVQRSMGILSDLTRESKRLYERLSEQEGLHSGYRSKGHLKLYRTAKGFNAARHEAESIKGFGIELNILEPDQIRKMVPLVLPDIAGGIYFPRDAHLIPHEFVSELAERVKKMGGDIRTGTEVLGLDVAGSEISKLRTTRGDFSADQIVLAGGAWSPMLIRDLNLRLPIQAGKGYSVTYRCPDCVCEKAISIPLLLKEAAVAVTPMAGMVRFSGTLELSGLDMSINEKRVNAFLRNAEKYIKMPQELELLQIWRGLRPCTPDGLPVIGRTKRYANLILATGHASIGMALGPVTGKLVSQIASNTQPDINMRPLGIERFEPK